MIGLPAGLGLRRPASSGGPAFANVKLLLHGDGSDGSTTIIDSSSAARTVTAIGDAHISTTSPKFGTGAIRTSGAGRCDVAQSTDFDLGASTQFCFECLVWFAALPTAANEVVFYAKSGTNLSTQRSWRFWLGNVSDVLQWNLGLSTDGGSGGEVRAQFINVFTPSLDTYYHLAVSRDSAGDTRFFVDGTQRGSTSAALNGIAPITVSAPVRVSGWNSGGSIISSLNGRLDEGRITIGEPVYTANFTAPTAPFPDS